MGNAAASSRGLSYRYSLLGGPHLNPKKDAIHDANGIVVDGAVAKEVEVEEEEEGVDGHILCSPQPPPGCYCFVNQ